MTEFGEQAEVSRAREMLGHDIEKEGALTRYVPRYGPPLPHIDLAVGCKWDGTTVRLTPAEARQLAAELVRLADEIDGEEAAPEGSGGE